MNLSLDIHGVIDRDPESFRAIATKTLRDGGEVTIISGALPDVLLQRLVTYDIPHTRWVSVTQFLINRGYPWEYDQHHRPSFDLWVWNSAKGNIIRTLNQHGGAIDIHVDDSAVYGETFPIETIFFHYIKEVTYEVLVQRLASRPSQCNKVQQPAV